jgi:1,4-dihydroxy-2-naphthoate octaprenyltransferase
LALLVALALQIGVNFANDYSDGIRGTDANRTGPARLTASGKVPALAVRRLAFIAFALAGVFGLILTMVTQFWMLLIVGALAILAAWFYTGGKRPYGYLGLGELFVFVFFGLVATLGTTYVQLGRITGAATLGAVGMGLFACAILTINNIRDIPTDEVAGKNTLAVKLGDTRSRWLYLGELVAALVVGVLAAVWVAPIAFLLLGLVIPVVFLVRAVFSGLTGACLIPILSGTAKLQLGYAAILAIAFAATAG